MNNEEWSDPTTVQGFLQILHSQPYYPFNLSYDKDGARVFTYRKTYAEFRYGLGISALSLLLVIYMVQENAVESVRSSSLCRYCS